jgi:hypothetical protein
MDDEDGGDEYGIPDLADYLSSSPAGTLPATPILSPSSKKKRKYSIG